MNDKFVKIIFPAIYGMSYDAAEKKGLFDQEVEDQDDELANTMDNEDDLEVVDTSNKRRGRLPKNLTRPNVEEVEEQEEEDGN